MVHRFTITFIVEVCLKCFKQKKTELFSESEKFSLFLLFLKSKLDIRIFIYHSLNLEVFKKEFSMIFC